MATNQGGPMTPHAQLVARLDAAMAELSACIGRQWNGDAALRMGIPARPGIDSDLVLMGALKAARDALAALPPPADQLPAATLPKSMADHVVGMDRDGNLLVKVANINAAGNTDTGIYAFSPPRQADPPALVALVREWQEAVKEETRYLCGPEPVSSARVVDINRRKQSACDAILAYPLPAAPPVTDTPQGDSK